jgi:hemerythrin-like domain-containing protein
VKRNENLKTLSWEHHDGLVVAFRLKQGLKAGIPRKTLCEYIIHVWENTLVHHFWQEEQCINSILNRTGEGKKLKRQMIDDHAWFRTVIGEYKNHNSDKVQIESFADRLNHHIRFEEKELFPFIEKHSSGAELRQIGDFLQTEHRVACHDWEPQFWKKMV